MQRPEEKKHPSTLDPQEFLYHGLGLAVFGDEQVTGTRSSSPRTRLFLTATPRLRQRIGLPGRRHGGAGMEACIAKGGCKGISRQGRALGGWHLLRLPVGFGSAVERSFFRVGPFLLLCLHPLRSHPFSYQIVFSPFLVCFYSTKNCCVVGGGVQWEAKGAKGCWGNGTVGCCFIPTLFLYFQWGLGCLLAAVGGFRKGLPRQKYRQRGQLLMVQSETQTLISEP